jgi:hypothetical protein
MRLMRAETAGCDLFIRRSISVTPGRLGLHDGLDRVVERVQ